MTLKPANSKNNNGRRFSGSGPRPDNNELKASEAKERNEAWAKLSPAQQLESLDRRLGKGVGAAKQRAKLQRLINEPQRQQPTVAHLRVKKDEAIEKEKAKDRRERERAESRSK